MQKPSQQSLVGSSFKLRGQLSKKLLNSHTSVGGSSGTSRGLLSPQSSLRKASITKHPLRSERETAKEEEKQRRDKNLSLEIKNYQRKTMLNGVDQQEILDKNHELVMYLQAHGVDPATVTNFKGNKILKSLHDLKIEYDSDYFNR